MIQVESTGAKQGKDSTSAKRRERFNQYQAREKIQPVPSARKDLNSAKHGKRFNQCQAREKFQPVQSIKKKIQSVSTLLL